MKREMISANTCHKLITQTSTALDSRKMFLKHNRNKITFSTSDAELGEQT